MDPNNQWFRDFYDQVTGIRRVLHEIAAGIIILICVGTAIAIKLWFH